MSPRSATVAPIGRFDAEGPLVAGAVFPKHLDDLKECRPHRTVSTWVELDVLNGEMWLAGQFVPTVEQRAVGSFTAASTREVLYLISIHYCAPSDSVHRVFAIFDAPKAGHPPSAPVKMRFADSARGDEDWRFLAVITQGASAPHFLVAHSDSEGRPESVAELTLNRPYVDGAPFADDAGAAPPDDYGAAQAATRKAQWMDREPWKIVAQFPNSSPDACTTFYSAPDSADGGAIVRMLRGDCAIP